MTDLFDYVNQNQETAVKSAALNIESETPDVAAEKNRIARSHLTTDIKTDSLAYWRREDRLQSLRNDLLKAPGAVKYFADHPNEAPVFGNDMNQVIEIAQAAPDPERYDGLTQKTGDKFPKTSFEKLSGNTKINDLRDEPKSAEPAAVAGNEDEEYALTSEDELVRKIMGTADQKTIQQVRNINRTSAPESTFENSAANIAYQGWMSGVDQAKQSNLIDKIRNEGRDATAEERAQIKAFDESQKARERVYGDSLAGNALFGSGQLLGQMIYGTASNPNDLTKSLALSGALAAISSSALAGGAVGSVGGPVGAAAGAGVGAGAGLLYTLGNAIVRSFGKASAARLVGASTAGAMAQSTYRMESADSYRTLVEQGVDRDTANVISGGVGLFNALVEQGALKALGGVWSNVTKPLISKVFASQAPVVATELARPTVSGALKEYAKAIGVSTFVLEPGEEVVQEIGQIVGETIGAQFSSKPDNTLLSTPEEAARRLWDIYWETAKSVFLLSAAGGLPFAAHSLRMASLADRDVQYTENLAKGAAAMQATKKDPDTVESFLTAQAQEAGADTVYVNGVSFRQAMIETGTTDERLAAAAPDVYTELRKAEAAGAGSDMQIPTGKYAVEIAGTNLGLNLKQHIRLNQDAVSIAEAARIRKEVAEQTKNILYYAGHPEELDQLRFGEDGKAVLDEFRQKLTQANEDLAKSGRAPNSAEQIERQARLGTQMVMNLARSTNLPFEKIKAMVMPNIRSTVDGRGNALSSPMTRDLKTGKTIDWKMGLQGGPNAGKRFIPRHHLKVPEVSNDFKADRKIMALKLGKGVINNDSGFRLTTSVNDAEKTLTPPKYAGKYRTVFNTLVADLDQVARDAFWVESSRDVQHKNKTVQGIHRFGYVFELDGHSYYAQLTVRDYIYPDNERTAVHAIDSINIDKIPSVLQTSGPEISARAGESQNGSAEHVPVVQRNESTESIKPQTYSRDGYILSDLLSGYKRADGHLYNDPIDPKEFEDGGVYFSPEDTETGRDGLLHQQTGRGVEGVFDEKEQKKWLKYKPEETSTGKIKGAPQGFTSIRQYPALLRRLRSFVEEGIAGRFWYEESASLIYKICDGDFVKSSKLLQLIAIYSPQAKIDANTVFMLQGYAQFARGIKPEDYHVKMAAQDEKALWVLYPEQMKAIWQKEYDDAVAAQEAEEEKAREEGRPFKAKEIRNKVKFYEENGWNGRKTNSFYENLLYALVKDHPDQARKAGVNVESVLKGQSTIDMWMKRAFGYNSDATTDDKGSGQYAFCENTLRRLTAELNASLKPGEAPWTPHQVQAAIWSGIMARYELAKEKTNKEFVKTGLAVQNGKKISRKEDPASVRKEMTIWHKNALKISTKDAKAFCNATHRSFATELIRMTQFTTWEAMPSVNTPGGKELNAAPDWVKREFTRNVHDALAYQIYKAAGFDLYSDTLSRGGYDGGVSPNMVGNLLKVVSKGQTTPTRANVRAACLMAQYVTKQDAVPFFRIENKATRLAEGNFFIVDDQGFRYGDSFPTKGKAIAALKARKSADKSKNYHILNAQWTKAYILEFGSDLTDEKVKEVLGAINEQVDPGLGLTQLSPRKILVANFRHEDGAPDKNGIATDVPWGLPDDQFGEKMGEVDFPGLVRFSPQLIDSEYGRCHDWEKDPEGNGVLEDLRRVYDESKGRGEGADSGRADGSWNGNYQVERNRLDAWRSTYDKILSDYTGDNLKRRIAAGPGENERAYQSAVSSAANGPDAQADIVRTFHQLAPSPDGNKAYRQIAGDALQLQSTMDRGEYDPSVNTIYLTPNADLTTFAHEMSHAYLNNLFNLAAISDPDSQVFKDAQTLLKAFNLNSIQEFIDLAKSKEGFEKLRSMQEWWAYQTEIYLSKGSSLDPGLRGILSSFGAWVRAAYKQFKGGARGYLNLAFYKEFGHEMPDMSPEVRDVMERMLGAENSFTNAESEAGYNPAFHKKPEGMADEDWKAYQDTAMLARGQGIEALQESSLKQMRWLSNARGKVLKEIQGKYKALRDKAREKIEEQVNNMDCFRLLRDLQGGETILGADPGDPSTLYRTQKKPGLKFAAEDLEEQEFPPEQISRLKKLKLVASMKDGGLPPDAIAELVGGKYNMTTGREIIDLLMTLPESKEWLIDQLTDQYMVQNHSDLKDPRWQEEQIQKALHQEARLRMVALEVGFFMKHAKGREIRYAAEVQASLMVGKSRFFENRPAVYQRMATRCANRSLEALKKGDMSLALTYKRQQLVAMYAVRKALEVSDSLNRLEKIRKSAFRGDKALAVSRDINLVNVVRAIFSSYGMAKNEDRAPLDYLADIQKYAPDSYKPMLELVEPHLSGALPVSELTGQQILDLCEDIKGIWDQSRAVKQVEVNGRKVELAEAVDSLVERTSRFKSVNAGVSSQQTSLQKAADSLASFGTAMKRVEHWCAYMDGDSKSKPFTNLIYRPIAEAATAYRLAYGDMAEKYRDLLKPMVRRWAKEPKISGKKYGIPYTFTKHELIGALLHSGNESNLQKLMAGRESTKTWGDWIVEPDGSAHYDTSRWWAFVQSCVDQKILTKEDLDFVQNVWDLLESTKPAAQKAFKACYGRYFEEIPARSFRLKFPDGTEHAYKGGYVPAVTDKSLDYNAQKNEEIDDLTQDSRTWMMPVVQPGFTKSRVPHYAQPLDLNAAGLEYHIGSVLRFAYIQPAASQVLRVLNNYGFKEELHRIDRHAMSDMLMPWLKRSCTQVITDGKPGKAMQVCNSLRATAGMNIMALNLPNAIQQFSGFAQSLALIGPRHFGHGLVTFFANPKKAVEVISELSPFMQTRFDDRSFEFQSELSRFKNPSRFTKAAEAKDWIKQHAYILQTLTQGLVDSITWLGAFDEAMGKPKGALKDKDSQAVKDAVFLADSVVRRTQSSFNAEDIAKIETGTAMWRMFLTFYNYFNNQTNLLMSEGSKAVEAKKYGHLFWVANTTVFLPAVLSDLIYQAIFSGSDDDDDGEDESLLTALRLLIGSPIRNMISMIPFGGNLTNYVAGHAVKAGLPGIDLIYDPKGYYPDRVVTAPFEKLVEDSISGARQLYKAANGDEVNPTTTIKRTAALITLVTGIPLNWAAKPLSYAAGVDAGTIQPRTTEDIVKGLVTGRDVNR